MKIKDKMKKSQIKVPKMQEFVPCDYQIFPVTTYDLMNDTRDFLNYYFKGACKISISTPSFKNAYISIDGFSYILRIVFKSVFGKALITVSDTSTESELLFNIEFDTSFLSEEDIENIKSVGKKSNIGIEFSSNSLIIRIQTLINFMPIISAISIRMVYRSLQRIFF